jgi:hypothetical protein
MCELMGIPILAFALGLYLPIHLSSGILIGGIIRVLVEKRFNKNETQQKIQTERGTLLASGLVAGDALMGIVIAAFAGLNINIAFGKTMIPGISSNPWVATIAFLLLSLWVYGFTVKIDKRT